MIAFAGRGSRSQRKVRRHGRLLHERPLRRLRRRPSPRSRESHRLDLRRAASSPIRTTALTSSRRTHPPNSISPAPRRDHWAPQEMVDQLVKDLKGANGEVEQYPDTDHGFAFPNAPPTASSPPSSTGNACWRCSEESSHSGSILEQLRIPLGALLRGFKDVSGQRFLRALALQHVRRIEMMLCRSSARSSFASNFARRASNPRAAFLVFDQRLEAFDAPLGHALLGQLLAELRQHIFELLAEGGVVTASSVTTLNMFDRARSIISAPPARGTPPRTCGSRGAAAPYFWSNVRLLLGPLRRPRDLFGLRDARVEHVELLLQHFRFALVQRVVRLRTW